MVSTAWLQQLVEKVPALTNKKVEPESILKKLRMNDIARKAALNHIENVGIDSMRFSNSPADQGNISSRCIALKSESHHQRSCIPGLY